MTEAVKPLVDTSITVDVTDYLALKERGVPALEQNNYEVCRDSLRHIAYAYDDYNALWLDEDFARNTRWGGIIAMPGYLYSHGANQDVRLRGRIVDSTGAVFDKADNMGGEWEFLLPVRPGDRVISRHTPTDAVVKRGARIGLFVLTSSESTYTNQRDEVVAIFRGVTARWSGQRQRELGQLAQVYTKTGLQPRVQEDEEARDEVYIGRRVGTQPPNFPARRYDRHDVYFEDVAEGSELPPYQIGPLSSYQLDRLSAHISNNAPSVSPLVEDGHVPAKYAGGLHKVAWFGSHLMQWAGPNAWVRKLNYRNPEWMMVGYTYMSHGVVREKLAEDGRHQVRVDLRIESEAGFVTGSGSAVVELLSRDSAPGGG